MWLPFKECIILSSGFSTIASMKKLSCLTISIIGAMSLSGCSCSRFITLARNNSFFTSGELKKVNLNGLPTLTYQSSHIEIKGASLKGYFNVEDNETVLDSYGKEILDYYKSSSLTYGAIMDYGYMFGIPNIFEIFKTRDMCQGVQHLKFYKLYNDRYAFFYEVGQQMYELLIKSETNTINDKEYNFYMTIDTVKQVRWSDDYYEVVIDDTNKDEYITMNAEVSNEEHPTIGLIKISFEKLNYYMSDLHILIDYTELGKRDTYHLGSNPSKENGYETSIVFRQDNNEPYQEGDLILHGFSISEESAWIIKKDTNQNNAE